jgi:hypothetical protein
LFEIQTVRYGFFAKLTVELLKFGHKYLLRDLWILQRELFWRRPLAVEPTRFISSAYEHDTSPNLDR